MNHNDFYLFLRTITKYKAMNLVEKYLCVRKYYAPKFPNIHTLVTGKNIGEGHS